MARLDNRAARRLIIARSGLAEKPTPKLRRDELLKRVERLGFVQIDSINTVERAHHMILFARNQTYRRQDLVALLERDRALFENWTHDASIIPTTLYPYWMRRFERHADRLKERFRQWRRDGFEEVFETVLERVREHGPCSSADVGEDENTGGGGWWDWKPSKTALEYLWRTGSLAVCHRVNFRKVYDLSERVIPPEHRAAAPDHEVFVDWACDSALARLGAASSGEIAAFWDLVTPAEAKEWCAARLGRDLVEVEIDCLAGAKPRRAFARPDILEQAAAAPEPPPRLRALSPFDPLLRDRARAERLFGFHYRIEVFTPAHKRQYGYYVFPLLDGDRMIGRIDMKRDAEADALAVNGLWLEPGAKLGAGRMRRLEAELERQRRFAGVADLRFADGWRERPAPARRRL